MFVFESISGLNESYPQMSVHLIQPLGLFNVHKEKCALFVSVESSCTNLPTEAHSIDDAFQASLPVSYHVECLKNSLKGGAYSMRYVPYHP